MAIGRLEVWDCHVADGVLRRQLRLQQDRELGGE